MMPSPPLPEITLRSAATVPPIVLLEPSTSMPRPALSSPAPASVPDTLRRPM